MQEGRKIRGTGESTATVVGSCVMSRTFEQTDGKLQGRVPARADAGQIEVAQLGKRVLTDRRVWTRPTPQLPPPDF